MLLDTCVVQHLATVFQYAEAEDGWTDEGVTAVVDRYPRQLATEIVALGSLVFAYRGEPAWVVSRTSGVELARLRGPKGAKLVSWWHQLADYTRELVEAFPELAAQASDSDKPWVGQLELPFDPPIPRLPLPAAPPFGPLADAGDRAVLREAVRHGCPAILTTDLRSFWRFRRWLYQFGVEVWRPTDAWVAIGGDPSLLLPA
jgi:hypothetical protein